jgi:hypothetical protein
VGTSVAVGVKEGVKMGNAVAVEVGIRGVSLAIVVLVAAIVAGRNCCCTNMHAVMSISVQATKRYDLFIREL